MEKSKQMGWLARNPRTTRFTLFAVIIIISIFTAWYVTMPKGYENDFFLEDVNGHSFKLSDFRRKIILLDFMATRCGPCQASMSGLRNIQEKFEGDLVIISISIDPHFDTDTVLDRWMDYWDATWIHARDTADPPISLTFEVYGVPTYLILDGRGNIIYKHLGLVSETTLTNEISELLG
jgi:cytochrome oxidase Cu insertion factor (SCO1/SenC/PrrC family)